MRPLEIHKTKKTRKGETKRSYTLKEKLAIIEKIKSEYNVEDSKSHIADDLNVKRKTLTDMLKNEYKIRRLVEEGKEKLKRDRKEKYPELEMKLVKWIRDTKERSPATVISGEFMQVRNFIPLFIVNGFYRKKRWNCQKSWNSKNSRRVATGCGILNFETSSPTEISMEKLLKWTLKDSVCGKEPS